MKFRWNLRTRLSMLVLLAVVPLLLLSWIGTALTARKDVAQTTKNLEFSAALVASDQQRIADSARRVLSAVALVPELVEGKEPACHDYFKTLTADIQIYNNVGVVGTDGFVRCESWPGIVKRFVGGLSIFKSAMASGDFVVGGYLVSRVNGEAIVNFALPIKGADGKPKALVFTGIVLSEIDKSLASVAIPAGGHVVVMDQAGVVLAASDNRLAQVGKPTPNARVRDALKAGVPSVFEETDESGKQHIYAFRPSNLLPNPPFYVLVSADKSEVLAPARQRLALNVFFLALITLLGVWLSWRLVGRDLVRATAKVLEATSQIQAGALDVRLPVRPEAANNEYSQIATSFNGMAESIQQREQEQARSYEELSKAQAQLLAAQKLCRMGNWEIDLKTKRLSWSAEVDELFGLQPGEFDGNRKNFLKLIHPDDLARYEKQVAEDNLTATQREIEYRIITPAGDVRWMLQLGSVKLDETGRPVSRSGVVQDITQQHKSREQLLLLEAAVAQLSDAVLITEADPVSKPGPRIVFVNHAFEKQTGYSWDEALGKTPRMLQGPNTQQSELQRISQALKACQPVGAELINYTKAGREFWVELEIIPIANTEGRCTHFVSVQRDITERKQAEAALIASEQRYAELFELAPVPMWVFDIVDHRFLNVNQAAIDNFGYSADEFKSMTIFDIREAPEQSELRDRLLNQAEPPPFSQYRRKDGSLLLVKVAYKPIEYAGRAARLVIGLDVTAQVNAEKGVQAQVLTLRRAADAAQAITWQQTIEGMLQEATEQARYVIEAHQCVISLTSDDDLPLVINALSLSDKYAAFKNAQGVFDGANLYDALSQNNGIVRMTQAELEAHPRWRDFENRADQYPPLRGWLAVPLTGRNGQNIGLLHLSDKHDSEFTLQDEYVALELAQLASIAIENTRLLEQVYQLNTGLEQKVAERTQALARQDALFRALAEQAPQVIWTADNRGDTNYFNRAWFELVGGSAESWTERKWVSVVHPDDREEIREKWMHAVATKTPFVGVRRLLGRDGNYHTMSYRASPVLDKHGAISFWVGIDADITEIKIIESALRLSNQELEAFSYSVSHDLRSPLNTIDGFSRLLAKNLTTEADSRAQHYLTRIQAGVAQMGQLIEELLLLAQVSRTELRHERVDLSDLSQSILQDWHVRDAHRHVTVHIEPGLVVQGDASLLRVLMENLLGNAWKFTAQRAEASISVGQQTDTSGTPVYFVRDNGAGFDMAYANKLFVAFQRLHAVSEFPGSGIGLATVSRVIGRHAGKVWADASPDYGATFFFTLPKVQITMKVDGLQGQIT